LQLTQALFKATPGAIYLEALGSQLTSGSSIANIAQSLSGNELFLGKLYADDLTSEAFAEALVTDLIGNHATDANKTLAKNYIVSRLDGGATQDAVIAEITHLLSTFPASDANWGAAATEHNTSNATKLVDNLVGDTVAAGEKQGAVDYILAQQASGQTFGQMVDWAINALAGMNPADIVWGNAAKQFDNRTEVSRYYSVEKSGSSTDLSKLQQILTNVTADAASVAAAKIAIDKLSSVANFDLSNLDGTNGFRLDGVLGSDQTGFSVSGAGDVNGDGFDDLIIGATQAGDSFFPGAGFVVFGKASGFNNAIELAKLSGVDGFRINGAELGGSAGRAVGSAGDINGDGLSDVIISSYGAENPNGKNAGFTYVIFGKESGLGATVDINTLDGTNGFRIDGEAEGDIAGYSVSTAGDINGDGFDDIVIGAPYSDHGAEDAGASYVVFGKASGFDAQLNLSAIDGTNGFRVEAIAGNDQLGKFAISTAGDFNKDGFDDLIVGSLGADSNGLTANGGAYIVFGKASGFTASIKLAELSVTDGLTMNGLQSGDGLGHSVSDAGDINNDGFADVIVGVPFGDGSTVNSGTAYVIFGHNLLA